MKLLFFGDVVGESGCRFFAEKAPELRRTYSADVIVVNGENSANGNGINAQSAQMLFSAGADIITGGNHSFRRKCPELFENPRILRPANYPEGVPGSGSYLADFGAFSLAVVNLMGTVFLDPLDNPFTTADRLIADLPTKNILVDFHAEATSEKRAIGWYLAGKVSAVIGTHTHVQTADEEILCGHTGYLTDAGMTGPVNSVIGVKTELAVRKQKYHIPVQFTEAEPPCILCGAYLEIDSKSGKCTKIERIFLREHTK